MRLATPIQPPNGAVDLVFYYLYFASEGKSYIDLA